MQNQGRMAECDISKTHILQVVTGDIVNGMNIALFWGELYKRYGSRAVMNYLK